MSMETVGKSCCIRYCPNFLATDSSIPFIRAPEDLELRAKWYESLTANPGVQVDLNFQNLCYLHFDAKEMKLIGINIDKNRSVYKLRNGALPIPIELPQQNKLPEHDIKFIDINAIKRDTNEQNIKLEPSSDDEIQINSLLPLTLDKPEGCGVCAENELKLLRANGKIMTLEEKLNEYKADNKKLMRHLGLKANKVMKYGKKPKYTKCDICWIRLERSTLHTHLCLDQEFIKCSYCTKLFISTQSLVDHLDDHADDQKTMYKCHVCPNVYPMIILLDCHKLSHSRTIELKSTPNNDSNKHDDILEEAPSIDITAIKTEEEEMIFEANNSINEDDDDSITITIEITDSTDEEEIQMIEPIQSIPATTNSQSTEMAPKYFKCGKCEMSFETGKELFRHMPCAADTIPALSIKKEQTSQEITSEPLNSASTTSRSTELTQNYYKCGNCGISFPTAKELSSHMLTYRLKCAKCETSFLNPALFARHIQSYSCIKSYECFECHQNKYLTSVVALRKHLEQHEKNRIKCTVCAKRFEPNEIHLCGNKKSVQCDYCRKKITATTELLEHLDKDHDEKKLHRCKKCAKFYPMQFLRDACLASHVDIPKTYTCETCSKSFAAIHNLSAHMKTHTNNIEKPYLCDECGKGFPSQNNLDKHKKTNIHREPTFQCPDCPKKFVTPSQLRVHSDVHRNNKYVCDICNSEHISIVGYRSHMKRHRRTDADRRFPCSFCSMKFFELNELKYHQAVHTAEKQFQCRFCDQAYKYTGDLNKHLKTHLGDKIYECPQCPMRFQYPMELKKHGFEHYKEEKARGINGDGAS